jgi:hypothetical protein
VKMNIIVNVDHWNNELVMLRDQLFQDMIPIEYVSQNTTMLDLLVKLELFSSKSQARKNWRGPIEIPSGFNHFERLGKLKKDIAVWNPIVDLPQQQ